MWLILSDSHDNLTKAKEIEKVIESYKIDTIFHCGDFVAPFILPYFFKDNIEFYGVFGNNDGERLLLSKKSNGKIRTGPYEILIQNFKIFLMHEPYALKAAKESNLYDFIFFGHTHELVVEKYNNSVIINPGESSGWLTGKATVVLLEPEEKRWEILTI
ncbi:metallophosphatase [Thermosipho melanesiensis]|uniref:Phosphoesterase n=2 Tax=Thermosipho melanesiensis TaxID=46541 RepID=A6LJ05_THEM4|nr:metallophosphoesterase [Thermosipho melanesiensis]ABR29906.1 phosphodiesterase, MJ0936 family [Thermosipho melanesiensis BI429]APT73114.1 metallophosphatase [Thermosipho melanesiensis]OOC38513.1 metallophosphatase [Thermosipho melanesiensis]OOC40317.1 metallophosphatase [Thermosipho melanesiensis]OOC40581.1 metallophosphatase [Thermosipho melanesiensis]